MRTFARQYAYDQMPGLSDVVWWKRAVSVSGLAALSVDGVDWATARAAPDEYFVLDAPYLVLTREMNGNWNVIGFGTDVSEAMSRVPSEVAAELDPPGEGPAASGRVRPLSDEQEASMLATAGKFANAAILDDSNSAKACSTVTSSRVLESSGIGWSSHVLDPSEGARVFDSYYGQTPTTDGIWLEAGANSGGSHTLEMLLVEDAGQWFVEDWRTVFGHE